jgi:hypothetical protein
MMWIPLVTCAVVFVAYARTLAWKHTCAGECVFCARDSAALLQVEPPGAATRVPTDMDLPKSA